MSRAGSSVGRSPMFTETLFPSLSTATSTGSRTLCPYLARMSLAACRFSGVSSSESTFMLASPRSTPLAYR